MQQLLPVFLTVFLAELGDKTQLATLLFAADQHQDPLLVFAAAAAALIAATGLAVLAGAAANTVLGHVPLKLFAGIGFILIGLWTIRGYFAGS